MPDHAVTVRPDDLAVPFRPGPAGPVRADGLGARCSRALLSPWSRLALLVTLLAAATSSAVVWEPQRLLSGDAVLWSGPAALALFALVYGLCTLAFVPKPLLNVAAGALFGTQAGLPLAVAGTTLGAFLAFGLGRALGRDALRPMLRGKVAAALDRQLSRHGFRSVLLMRLLPGVPFAAANYGAALSSTRCAPFLVATAVGVVPNTAAYVLAGSRADTPGSPVFWISLGAITVTSALTAAAGWRAHVRHRRARTA
ncbi:TVP38/TMEM64 family protein [Streptomyces thermolineatus]|uniref:TVP38/TMEM64 family protein n=1 Tax=Streptomyces thermolineatus TaxID=44033 RepID=UPI00384A7A28